MQMHHILAAPVASVRPPCVLVSLTGLCVRLDVHDAVDSHCMAYAVSAYLLYPAVPSTLQVCQ